MRGTAFLVALATSACPPPSPSPSPSSSPSSSPSPLALTWLVGPPTPKARRVDLRVAIDATERCFALGSESGGLLPENQSACGGPQYAKEPAEIAKLTLYEAGAGGFAVRRRAGGSLEIVHWAEDDGACPGDGGEVEACPVEVRQVATLPAPGNRRVVESIRLVDARGRERPYVCATGDAP
jgi:hypothetical protein